VLCSTGRDTNELLGVHYVDSAKGSKKNAAGLGGKEDKNLIEEFHEPTGPEANTIAFRVFTVAKRHSLDYVKPVIG
jgi:hypothetical protein